MIFDRITANMTRTHGSKGAFGTGTLFHHFSGTLPELCAFTRETLANCPKERARYHNASRLIRTPGLDDWAGFREAPASAFVTEGYSADALKVFDIARAKLDIRSAPGRPQAAVVGGSWNVPLLLQGHPLSAIKRPRTALPPLNIHISASFSWKVDEAYIATQLARVARALWDYTLRGGVATLTISYVGGYTLHPSGGEAGFILSLKPNLASTASIASSLSVQVFRLFLLGLTQAHSGKIGDSVVVLTWQKPGLITLTGDPSTDNLSLKKAGIL